jgi:hypothetical protein
MKHPREHKPEAITLTAEEEAVYQHGTMEGLYQGLLDYPTLLPDIQKALLDMAHAAYQENTERKREIFVGDAILSKLNFILGFSWVD